MTRKGHLDWCKKRALEYVDARDLMQAVTSMLSDVQKHPETAFSETGVGGFLALNGMMLARDKDVAGVRHWIEGFN